MTLRARSAPTNYPNFEQYAAEWHDLYRRYQRTRVAPVRIGLPFIVVWIALRATRDYQPDPFFIDYLLAQMEDAFLWIVIPCVFGPLLYLRLFFCPRCHRRFFGGWHSLTDRRSKLDQEARCYFCGLDNAAWHAL